MITVNVNSVKRCAFCKQWYDPTNGNIQQKSQRIGTWTFDEKAKCYCKVKKRDMRGGQFCSEYTCKL